MSLLYSIHYLYFELVKYRSRLLYDALSYNISFSAERMTGHQQLVNDVKFSPDTRLIASASFDKSIRLWSGVNGK